MADEVREAGVKVVTDIVALRRRKFDVIHAQHSVTALLARAACPGVPMVFVAHGNISEYEQLPAPRLAVRALVGVSRETVDRLAAQYGVPRKEVAIVDNPVDADRFRPTSRICAVPEQLLVLSNHYVDTVRAVVDAAAAATGLTVTHVGLPDNPRRDVERWINDADIVVTLGRGALEAMACGRNVIVYDWNGGDGLVTPDNFDTLRSRNFSGRMGLMSATVDGLVAEIRRYDPLMGRHLRQIVVETYGTDMVAAQLERIYMKAMLSVPVTSRPGRVSRFFLHPAVAHRYVRCVVWINRVRKVMRLLGLTRDLSGRRAINIPGLRVAPTLRPRVSRPITHGSNG